MEKRYRHATYIPFIIACLITLVLCWSMPELATARGKSRSRQARTEMSKNRSGKPAKKKSSKGAKASSKKRSSRKSKPAVRYNARYRQMFDDLQPLQLAAAEALGITPQDDTLHIRPLINEGLLVDVSNDTLFDLTADSPYLVPRADSVLCAIATEYQKLMPGRQLRVTDCLRTLKQVAALRRVNGNAVTNSCHLYGTTFDISYSRMNHQEREALATVLTAFRDEEFIFVKYEIHQPCFHITVRPEGFIPPLADNDEDPDSDLDNDSDFDNDTD